MFHVSFVSCSQLSMPFAVVGSNTLIEVCGKKVRGRLYPWGVVEGEIQGFLFSCRHIQI